MNKFILMICLFSISGLALGATKENADCRQQVIEKDILTMCMHKGSAFAHDYYSLSLNNQTIFYLPDDYVENIQLEHLFPPGITIEFSLSKQVPVGSRVKIVGGCTPVSKNETEVGRKCNFHWGNKHVIQNIFFEFPDTESNFYKICKAGQDAVVANRHTEGRHLLNECIADSLDYENTHRQALTIRAWANYSLGLFQEATNDQSAAFRISPAQSYSEIMNMAIYHKSLNKHQEALIFLGQAEVIDKAFNRVSMMTQYHIGWNLRLLKKYDSAIKVLTAAIPAQPDYAFIYYQRGLAHEGLRNKEATVADFQKMKELIEKTPSTNLDDPLVQQAIKKIYEYGIVIEKGKTSNK